MSAAALRRLTSAGWRGYIAAAAILIAAAAAIFASASLNPVTARLFFSASNQSTAVISMNSSSNQLKDYESEELRLKALPSLESEEFIISSDNNGVNIAAPPLDSEAPNSSSVMVLSPLSLTENVSGNLVNFKGGGGVETLPLHPEVPAAVWLSPSTGSVSEVPPATTSMFPPPFPSSPPIESSTKSESLSNSLSNDAMSSNGGKEMLPSRPEVPNTLTETNIQLMYAKKDIAHAPVISDDPDLYAPLFRNVSIFKRSYELMETILKVYIYRDGRRPIFHTPELKGIYASEGWFMKLMEANKKFVVKSPEKAHLFYLPYSARQLQVTLYRPVSHNWTPLAVFLKNYIDGISARYPFWNRTRGADHFLVACHDWGGYTTKLHAELNKITIKALCNADLSEGFIYGKDVSLPETYIRNPRKPLRGLGGQPISKRRFLAFFAGNMHGRVRPVLLDYWKGKDEDMKIYGPLPAEVARRMPYIQHMKSSKFCICPMGYEVNSPRIVESIYYECVPVIIADNFVLPFDEVLNWNAFSIVIAEKDIPNLKDILINVSPRKYGSMHENVKKLRRHFLWHPRPVKYDLFHMILHSIWFNRLNQIEING